MSSMLTHLTDHLVWSLPILLREGFHDACRPGDASNWEILSGITKSCFRTRLGMFLCTALRATAIDESRSWSSKVPASQ